MMTPGFVDFQRILKRTFEVHPILGYGLSDDVVPS